MLWSRLRSGPTGPALGRHRPAGFVTLSPTGDRWRWRCTVALTSGAASPSPPLAPRQVAPAPLVTSQQGDRLPRPACMPGPELTGTEWGAGVLGCSLALAVPPCMSVEVRTCACGQACKLLPAIPTECCAPCMGSPRALGCSPPAAHCRVSMEWQLPGACCSFHTPCWPPDGHTRPSPTRSSGRALRTRGHCPS